MSPRRRPPLLLCYHALSDEWPSALAVSPGDFAEQIEGFADQGYTFTTFHDAVCGPTGRRVCAITFDDAYLSIFELGFPVLQQLGAVATVFAPSTHVSSPGPLSWPGIDEWIGGRWETELTSMSWEQLRVLADAGWEIGSHTESHPRLSQVDPEDLARELGGSRVTCGEKIGRPCQTIAYPYGDFDERVVEAAAAAGFEAGATLVSPLTGGATRAERLQCPRVAIYRGDRSARIRAKARLMTRHPWAWNAATALRRRLAG